MTSTHNTNTYNTTDNETQCKMSKMKN